MSKPERRPEAAIVFARSRWPALAGLLFLVHVVVVGLVCLAPNFQASIANPSIVEEQGAAYVAAVHLESFLYVLPVDSMAMPEGSKLILFEDGNALGPSHSLHVLIRERGDGRYSHWGNSIIFSTSDNSDPRTNGRVYSIASPTALNTPLRIVLTVALVLADLVFYAALRKEILAFLRSRASVILGSLAISVIVITALAAFGAFGRLVIAEDGAPADAALAIDVLQHACLGCLISFGFWAAGAGIVRLVLRDNKAGLPQILIPAFPVGLVVLAVLATISLVVPSGRSIALVMWSACLLPLLGWRPRRQDLMAALKAVLGIVPLAILFGIWLGLLWHGPTDTLSGSPSGDLTFYSGAIWSFAERPYPLVDLGYEGGAARGYFNFLFPALGATLFYLPGFDPFLYLLASGGTCYVLLSALMLHLYLADRPQRSAGAFAACILLLSFLVAARYPYWVAESIPVVFVPALVIATWWMAERGKADFRWIIAAMVTGLGGSILSKVTTAAVLVPLGAAGLWKQFRLVRPPIRAVILAIACVFGAYCLAMLSRYLPAYVATADIGPESLRSPRWWFVARDGAALVLVVLAWRIADPFVAVALTAGLAAFLLFSFLFQIEFVCVALVLGLLAFADPERLYRSRVLAVAGFALALPAAVLSDPAGASSGLVWLVSLGGAVLVAILSAIEVRGPYTPLTFRATAAVAVSAFAVAGFGLAGIARGRIIADSGWHLPGQELTPELKDIWSAVRRLTPPDALIFTDQVDETIDLLGGWNTYAFSGQRQIFLSSYYAVMELRKDKARLNQLLSMNEALLRGIKSPADVPTRSRYDTMFAVVSTSRTVPPAWKRIYRNRSYAIFQIAPQD